MHNPPSWFQQVYYNGKPVSGALLNSYTAGNTNVPCPVYYDEDRTIAAPNPLSADAQGIFPQYYLADVEYKFVISTADGVILATRDYVSSNGGGTIAPTDTYKVMTYSGDTTPDYLQSKLIAGNNMTISLSGSDLVLSASTTSTDDHKVLVGSTDPTPGFLFDKVVPGPFVTVAKAAGVSGEAIQIAFRPVVSADGTDVPNYLINKLSANNTPIGFESYNGKVNLTFDYAEASAGLTNTPYTVWFSDSNGKLSRSSNLTYGDPNHGGNSILYSQNFLAGSNFVINGRGFNALSDGTLDLQFATNGARVKIAVQDRVGGVYGTAFISAHNNANTASIVTDRASFSNLSDGRLVFSAKLSGEDLVYMHTATGLSFNPTSNILTAPNLAIGSLSAAGILTNDASGNVSSVPASTFTDSQQVLVSPLDTAAGYLGTKLAAGTNIGFNVTSDSHGQKLWISARSNMLLNPTYVQAAYTVVDSDSCVVTNTNNSVTVTLPTPGSTYNGRAVYVYNTGSGSTTINTVSGGIIGYTPSISSYGKLLFRCLQTAQGTYAWMCGA